MFELLENWKILYSGLWKIKMWSEYFSRKMPDSPAPQQGAFKPISELQLQLVYVYTFSTLIYFLPKSTSFPPTPPRKKK